MEGAQQATANQIRITKSERGNTEVVRDDVGGYSKIQPGEFPAGPVNCHPGSVLAAAVSYPLGSMIPLADFGPTMNAFPDRWS